MKGEICHFHWTGLNTSLSYSESISSRLFEKFSLTWVWLAHCTDDAHIHLATGVFCPFLTSPTMHISQPFCISFFGKRKVAWPSLSKTSCPWLWVTPSLLTESGICGCMLSCLQWFGRRSFCHDSGWHAGGWAHYCRRRDAAWGCSLL